jgi:hypothetical protein
METPMLTVLGDVTSNILTICDNKGKREFNVNVKLDTFRKLVINHGDTTKQYQLSFPYVYNYGGFGIVFGLTEFDESKSGEVRSNNPPTHILKVDCSSQDGVILATAIKVNRAFNEYGRQYDRYKALEYGKITDSSKTFAVYTFLGEELNNLIFGPKRGQMLRQEAIVKTIIRNVIGCLLDFNRNHLLHGDVSLLNFVIDTDNNVSLIDFDTMKNLKKLIGGECSIRMSKDENDRHILGYYDVSPSNDESVDANEPVQIKEYWGNPMFPSFTRLMKVTRDEYDLLERSSNSITRNAEISNRLMMPDKFGLFWVIVKILLGVADVNLTEAEIEDYLMGVKDVAKKKFIDCNNTYMDFYKSLDFESLDFESLDENSKFVKLGNKILVTADYIEPGDFDYFVIELIKLINLNNNDGNIVSFTNLLRHPFLADTRQTSQLTTPPSEVTSVVSPHGGSYNKKRRPSRATRHTKKRNTRKKQNRRNKTKRVKLNRIRK